MLRNRGTYRNFYKLCDELNVQIKFHLIFPFGSKLVEVESEGTKLDGCGRFICPVCNSFE